MSWMLKIRVKRGLVLELHDATKGISLGAGRDVCAHVSFEKSGNDSLEGGNIFGGSILLRVGSAGLPLESKDVKDGTGRVFRFRRLR